MKRVVPIFAVGVLFLAACTLPQQSTPTAPQVESEDSQGTIPLESTTDAILPASFYFISQGQIWRGEEDGQSFDQITQEVQEVIGMDVSPVDSSLAYVSGNQLILTDARGDNRRVLVEGISPQDTDDEMYRVRDQISSPAWAPDGQRLAYGHNGVNLIDVNDGQTIHLLENPDPPTGGHDMISILFPITWTLDGESLFVNDMTSCRLISVDAPGDTQEIRFNGGCDFTWSIDHQSVYSAESGSEYTTFGVWQVDIGTGEVSMLLGADENYDWMTSAAFPKQTSDGRLFFFFRVAEEGAEPMFVSTPLDDLRQMTTIRPISLSGKLFYSDALWAPDASLVIVAIRNDSMYILPTDESAMITLPISGASNLRWGVQ
jgi:Tol biopolymer transport system component